MRLLLDSHIVHDVLFNSARLPGTTRAALMDPANEVFVSAITPYELELKRAIGKLSFPLVGDWAALIRLTGFEILDITIAHGVGAARLPLHHRDPWDRMLVAQAVHEALVLATNDQSIKRYGVPTFS